MASRRRSIEPVILLLLTACSAEPASAGNEPSPPNNLPASSYRGTLTFAREGPADVFHGANVIDLDLASNKTVVRFDGFDAQRVRGGETAYITRLGAGYVSDAGIVVATGRGITEAPLYVCPMFNHTSNRVCHTPKLSPDARLVAFGTVGGGGTLCKDNFGMFWASYVAVRDRKGAEVARFEGYYAPEWLPDGRLLMLGSACRGAGVWLSDRSLGAAARIDGNQLGTPASFPAVSPDGGRVALVWGGQLWALGLDARHELTQLTRSEKPVSSAAWSPDGKALAVLLFDVTMPLKLVWIFRPGDETSQEVRNLPFYPFGPISWN